MKTTLFNWLKIVSGILAAILLLEIGLRAVDLGLLRIWSASSARGRQMYEVNPQIGWVLKPHLNIIWETRDGYETLVETNSRGLRDQEYDYQKTPGVYRILLLGDSFAEALQMPLADIFPTTVESCLSERLGRPVEVINAGMTAYSIGDEYLYYLNEGQKYDPDLVLISLFGEYSLLDLDRQDDQTMVKLAGAYRFDLVNNHLKKNWLSWTTPSESLSGVETFLRQYSRIYQILWHPDAKFRISAEDLTMRISASLGLKQAVAQQSATLPPWHYFVFADDFTHNPDTPPETLDRWRTFQSIFQEFHSVLTTDQRQIAVMVIPNKYQVHQRFREAKIINLADQYSDLGKLKWNLEKEPNHTFDQFFRQQNIPMLDLLPYFQAHDAHGGYSLYYDLDLHFNREGHYMVRDLSCNWLIDSKVISQ